MFSIGELIGEEKGFDNVEELDINGCKLTGKAGIFLGDALVKNPNYKIEKINLKSIRLGVEGLCSLLRGAN